LSTMILSGKEFDGLFLCMSEFIIFHVSRALPLVLSNSELK